MSNIMLIEDDLEMQELLKDYLENYGFKVHAFADPKIALEELKKGEFVLVILDLMLPKIDGFEVCKMIRVFSTIAIIISSARGNLGDKVLTFEYGADDYLAKPYEPKELIIRINAVLRRIVKSEEDAKKRFIGEFCIDEEKLEIQIDNHILELTKIEYEILLLMLNSKGKVVSRGEIAAHIKADLKDRSIDMHISNLRNKIFDDPKYPKYIKSVWGIGYKFIG
ncbi:response regulator transcription factor [Campylobacter fetus]|uniref:response regulator transcription factor n=1 Tax=Campylobacter fetus TaxID=196 RepID=UPI00190AFCE2|nr:response regulator transcription factor [Campylobacter fetus]MBK3501273.1 response regulator transcription factor [Campylobacter fetus subsp. venerealis]